MDKMLKEASRRVKACAECPFLINYTVVEDFPQQVRYCALLVEFTKYGWIRHSPDYSACPLKTFKEGIQ